MIGTSSPVSTPPAHGAALRSRAWPSSVHRAKRAMPSWESRMSRIEPGYSSLMGELERVCGLSGLLEGWAPLTFTRLERFR